MGRRIALRELAAGDFDHTLVAGFAAATKRMCDAGSSASGFGRKGQTADAKISALLSYWKL
jgi:hypothetical protein